MAADIGEVRPGKSVAVWGAGPIGLAAMAAARAMGAQRIIAIDNVPHRLAAAREKLSVEAINFDEDPPVDAIRELTHGRGTDVCIEAETDAIDSISEILKSVKKGGNVAIMGDFIGYANHFPIGALMEKGVTIRSGQVHVQKYWKTVLEKMLSGEYDPSFTITHRIPLARAAEAYRMFDRKEDGVIKVMLETDAAA
jgi:threonine dehydrogenase-like Zn-dependent dehydrogenase